MRIEINGIICFFTLFYYVIFRDKNYTYFTKFFQLRVSIHLE